MKPLVSRLLAWVRPAVITITLFGFSSAAILYGLGQIALHDRAHAVVRDMAGGDLWPTKDGYLVITAEGEGVVRLYRLGRSTGAIHGHRGSLVRVAFIAGGRRMLTIDRTGLARVTDLASLEWNAHVDFTDTLQLLRRTLWDRSVGRLAHWSLPFAVRLFQLDMPEFRRGGRGAVFRDCEICPELVEIRPGSFLMGSTFFEKGRAANESPRRLVSITDGFALGRFSVTFAEWDAAQEAPDWRGVTGREPRKPDDRGWGRQRRPVVDVSWNDASAYATWLTKRTGRTYRLPNEEEREFAARAGATSTFSWGNEVEPDHANCAGCSNEWGGKKTAPVGSFPANAFGLYDMQGNVSEWVDDCYEDFDTVGSPVSQDAALECSLHVIRGGSWASLPQQIRAAYRDRLAPDSRDEFVGFRVAASLSSE